MPSKKGSKQLVLQDGDNIGARLSFNEAGLSFNESQLAIQSAQVSKLEAELGAFLLENIDNKKYKDCLREQIDYHKAQVTYYEGRVINDSRYTGTTNISYHTRAHC
jgi:hypothetical protein